MTKKGTNDMNTYLKNITPETATQIWARFEEHGEHDTVMIELGGGKYVARCAEHNVNHLLCEAK